MTHHRSHPLRRITLTVTLAALGLLGFAPQASWADELVLVQDGQSEYQIVLPEPTGDPAIDGSLQQTARLVQKAFSASQADLPIVTEPERDTDRPGIFLGNTAFARDHGCDPADLDGWDYYHKVIDQHVIILGRDHAPPEALNDVDDLGRTGNFYYRLGTLKAVADFLREYTQTYFLYPGQADIPHQNDTRVRDWTLDGAHIAYTERATISVPADLDLHKELFIRYHHTHRPMLYHIAHNLFPKVDDALLGHTYGRAIPPDEFRESNPEYFALLGGERTRQNQYCLSNPEVRERIYQFTESFLAMGCASVNILQPDGFRPCQCEDCHALYDTGDDWGEKLWIFHRNIAERLLEKHPDKKLLISPYTVTNNPPKSFERFPRNVIINHVDANFETTRQWEEWGEIHDGEYAIWLHNWIPNQTSRYVPMRTPLFVEKQARFFHEHHVRGMFRDGRGDVFGLEGPTYYVFGRIYDDPANLQAADLFNEFNNAAFGSAAPAMKRFYDRLHHNVQLYSLYLGTHGVGWAYRDIYGRGHKHVKDPFRMLGFMYTAEMLNTLEDHLADAERRADDDMVKARLQLVRREFEWVKTTARVIHLHEAYEIAPSLDARDRLLDAIDQRNESIDGFYSYLAARDPGDSRYDRAKDIPGWPRVLFPPGGHNASHLRLAYNRYQESFADTAMNWDTEVMRGTPLPGTESLAAQRATGEIALNSPQWESAPAVTLQPVDDHSATNRATTVRVLFSDQHLYVRAESQLDTSASSFENLGRDADLTQRESFDVYLAPLPGRDVYYRFTVGPDAGSKFDAARGLITDTMNIRYNRDDPNWNGDWTYTSQVEDNQWLAMLRIPYATLDAEAPTAGESWRINFGRTHRVGEDEVRHAIWSTIGSTRDVGDRNALGELTFEQDED